MIILDEKLAVLKQNLLAVLIVIFMLSFLFVNADLDSEILVNIKLSDDFYQVLPGEIITTETEIILLREAREDKVIDLLIEYFLINSTDSTIFKLSETKGTILSSHSVREFLIPSGLNPGLYKIMVKVSYDDYFRVDSELFEVISNEESTVNVLSSENKLQDDRLNNVIISQKTELIFILVLIFLTFIIIMYYEHKKYQQMVNFIGRVSEKDLKNNNFIKNHLRGGIKRLIYLTITWLKKRS